MDYPEVLDCAEALAEKQGAEVPEQAWLYLDNAYYWPNPHYKGEPVCHPELDPETADGMQFHPRKGSSLRERFLKRQNKQ